MRSNELSTKAGASRTPGRTRRLLTAQRLVAIAAALALSGTGVVADAAEEEETASARAAYARAHRLHKAGKYVEALEWLDRVDYVDDDSVEALIEYERARTLAALRGEGMICDYDAYLYAIIEILEAAVGLDPQLLKAVRTDAALEPVRGAFGYWSLLGLEPGKTEDTRKLLVNVAWQGPAPGAYGVMSSIWFSPDGKVGFWRMHDIDDEGTPISSSLKGTYEVTGTRVFVHLEDPTGGPLELEGTLDASGELDLGGDFFRFTDDPSDCEA